MKQFLHAWVVPFAISGAVVGAVVSGVVTPAASGAAAGASSLDAAIAAPVWAAAKAVAPATDAAIVHVLNRITYGPRPGDVDRVRALGISRFVDEQLHPDRIDDQVTSARLAPLTTLHLSVSEAVRPIEPQSGEADGSPRRPPAQVKVKTTMIAELAEQKVVRAVYSDRQLQEVLTDFWFNHFNVDARKGRDGLYVSAYERDVIRPHVLGRFRDLLGATAKSPAMLFYLDNWMNVDPNGPHPEPRPRMARRFNAPVMVPPPPRPQPANGAGAKRGLNENYARELMELHTLGVDGGYTQHDVTEVARAFTGWTIENPRRGGGFVFNRRLHDPGSKVVLGHTIKAGGDESDGEKVLDILAQHPSTAKFVAMKLARHFVSDTPPPGLVDRAAKRFRDTDGDLREVTRTILMSPEFSSPDAYGAKVKTPFEYVVSALRASGTDVADATSLVRQIQQMGMPLYMCQPPTGYKDTADAWVNTGGLVARINFALKLAGGDRALGEQLGAPEFQKR